MKLKYTLCALAISAAPFSWAHDHHWSYESPDQWGEINADFATCKNGQNQSPIDIRSTVNGQLQPLAVKYNAKQKSIVNNGHTVQINVQDGDDIKVDDETFTLRQFHFHTPAENMINGESFPLEVHFVHSSAQGGLAVMGVMFKPGAMNPTLEAILRSVPAKVNEEKRLNKPLDLSSLKPVNKQYYRYSGSLTTPPCTEGVRWLVMKDAVYASPAQIASFEKILGEHGNSRPVQTLNGRVIVE